MLLNVMSVSRFFFKIFYGYFEVRHRILCFICSFGYPDETYLDRVKDELAAVGVTEELLERFGKS